MKRLFSGLVLFFSILTAQAQEAAKLSPLTRQYIAKWQADKSVLPKGYVYKHPNGQQMYVSALIKVKAGFDAEAFESLGVKIGTKAGNIWTAQIPVSKVADLAAAQGITYLQLDEPVHPAMDSVRKVTRVDSVHAGLGGLPSAYHGSNVVVGIIDAGFDYRHPTLFDTSGNTYRVKRVWEQLGSGTPPPGFAYGNELTNSADMWIKGNDMTISHGAHVSGISSGSGYGSDNNSQFRGIAPASDLVFVGITPPPSNWTETGMSDIIDGMNYIFTYAASVGKPAVANLSWGCSIGPHDGLSLFSQACDNLTGPGRIFVCSAGNNGDTKLHLQKTFTATDTALKSFVLFNSSLGEKRTWVDVWGDSSKSFCVELSLFAAGSITDATGFICLDNQLHNEVLIGSDNDTLFVAISTSDEEFNGKPRIFLDIHNKSANAVLLTVRGSDGVVNSWTGFVKNTTGYYADFASNGYAWATGGNTSMTIGDMASTRSALAVGAFTSKNSYTNVSSSFVNLAFYAAKGTIAPFSSRGPTSDGRIKPDITAPGLVLGSAINSYDPSFQLAGGSYNSVVHLWTDPQNSREYAYAMLMGTSMSSPAASGIVALMLEANPALTPLQVQIAIAETALQDNFTTTLPPQGNNIWGHGKINAMAAVKRAMTISGVPDAEAPALLAGIYPNPAKDYFIIENETNEASGLEVQVRDITGRIMSTLRTGSRQTVVNTSTWSRGFYIICIRSGENQQAFKLSVN